MVLHLLTYERININKNWLIWWYLFAFHKNSLVTITQHLSGHALWSLCLCPNLSKIQWSKGNVDVYTQIELQRLAVKQPSYCTYETNDTPGLTIAVCSSEVSKKVCLAAPGEEATIIATKAPLNSPPLGEELGLWNRVGKVSHSLREWSNIHPMTKGRQNVSCILIGYLING